MSDKAKIYFWKYTDPELGYHLAWNELGLRSVTERLGQLEN
ncbi:MAG: hypothetical protein AAF434_13710 [Pseudomonadota bacterium]